MADTVKKNGLDNPSFELGENAHKSITNTEKQQTPPTATHHQWGNSIEFLMSCIAMSVGLGNIWRFPFTAYENGGGAFLIPYIIIVTFVGRPLYYLEMALGQFSSRGNTAFFGSLAPFLKGVGYAQLLGSICTATYYCSLMAITLFYFLHSFTSSLPWSFCLDEWKDYLEINNLTCVPASDKGNNATYTTATISSSELWFTQEVLKETKDISQGIGTPDWRLTLCLLFSWFVTFLVSIKGVQSSGKASYFLAIFPYVIIVTILIRAATLDGAAEGMYYFIRTDWSKLLEPDVWYAAVTQCFFSLNVGFGSIIMYSAHNDFGHNINRDAMIVTTLDTFTSLLSGLTIFGILGNLAWELNVTPDEVINSGGVGLAFISYPDAIAKFEAVPWLFAILFFFMLFVLGIGSLVALHGSMNIVGRHLLPHVAFWKISVTTAICSFLIGLIYVTPGGQFMLNLVDFFGGTFVIFLFVIIEVVGVSWYYGLNNLCRDIEFMLKQKVGVFWRMTWGIFTPLILIIIFGYFLVKLERLTYANQPYPDSILAVGWCILGFSVIQFIGIILYDIWKNKQLGWPEMVRKVFSHENWGPIDVIRHEEWRQFRNEQKQSDEISKKSFLTRCVDALIGR